MRTRKNGWTGLTSALTLVLTINLFAFAPAHGSEVPDVSVLLEVDLAAVVQDRLDMTASDIRRTLRDAKIVFTGLTASGDTVSLRITDAGQFDQAMNKIMAINSEIKSLLPSHGGQVFDIAKSDDNTIV